MAELFLVRTKQNQIWGPIAKELLAERVAKGELDFQDEICAGGQYWIFLHETEEVRRALGVIPPARKKTKNPDDDDTETDTQTDTAVVEGTPTQPLQDHVAPAPGYSASPASSSPAEPGQNDAPIPYYEQTHYRLEQPGIFKVLAFAIFLVIAYIVYRVFWMTGSG